MKLFFCPRDAEEVVVKKSKVISADWHGGIIVVANNVEQARDLAIQYDDIDFRQLKPAEISELDIKQASVIYDDDVR